VGVRIDVEDHGDRIESYASLTVGPQGIPVTPRFGINMDNVMHVEDPSLAASPDGVKTEWDASTLDSAIRWLREHAEHLNTLLYQMVDIQEQMGRGGSAAGQVPSSPGGPARKSSLGSFYWAGQLADKHDALYRSTEVNIRTLRDNLHAAADALVKVKENYETAEAANAMSADEMARIFADVSRADRL
jgi:uncharacterized protein YukE